MCPVRVFCGQTQDNTRSEIRQFVGTFYFVRKKASVAANATAPPTP